MERRVSLEDGETYHIFNRGAHKQSIFLEERDFQRFQVLLLLANSHEKMDVGNTIAKYQGPSLVNLFTNEVSNEKLVDIMAYSLLPNHFHFVLRQSCVEGISTFMRKLCTAYSMYFNLKYGHSGTLFQGRFKSSHVNTDPYFNWIFAYVHINAVALVEPKWSEKKLENPARAQKFVDGYKYSSYYDFYVAERPERAILAYDEALHYVEKKADIRALLSSYGSSKGLYTAHGLDVA